MSSSERKQSAKDMTLGKGNTTSQQRINHRNEFATRLKALRIREVDRLRQICNEGLGYGSLVEIRKMILTSRDSRELIEDPHEFDDIIKEIEQELSQMEFEQYEKENLNDIESLTKTHSAPCSLCETLTFDGVICETCKLHISSEY